MNLSCLSEDSVFIWSEIYIIIIVTGPTKRLVNRIFLGVADKAGVSVIIHWLLILTSHSEKLLKQILVCNVICNLVPPNVKFCSAQETVCVCGLLSVEH